MKLGSLPLGVRFAFACAVPIILVLVVPLLWLTRLELEDAVSKQREIAEVHALQLGIHSSFDILTEDERRIAQTIKELAVQVPELHGCRIRAASGSVLGDWTVESKETDWDENRPGYVIGTSDVLRDGERIGSVELALDLDTTYATVERKRMELALASLLLIAVVVTICLLAGARISKSIRLLAAASDRLAQGDFRGGAQEGADEVGRLGRAFNTMSSRLNRTIRAMEEARDKAEDSARVKQEFLANMSHELRTPLNGVIGMGEILQNTALTPDQRQCLETIETSARSLLDVLNEILDLSKIEAGMLELEENEFDPTQCVESVADLLATQAYEKGIELVCRISEDIPQDLIGDARRLRQILINLIGNATKFTEAGEVVVDVGVESVGEASCDLCVSVSDTGIGIEKAEQERLFEAFTQADSSTSRKYGGTGLGLTICKRMVETMQGTIGCESTPGTGSRFWFRLPLGLARPLSAERPRRTQEKSGSDRRLVIAVANASVRDVVRGYAEGLGFSCTECGTGDEVLEYLRNNAGQPHALDCLVLESSPYGAVSVELAQEIIATYGDARPRIACLVTPHHIAIEEDHKSSGVDAHITKPVKRRALRRFLLEGLKQATSLGALVQGVHRSEVQEPACAPPSEALPVLLVEDDPINKVVGRRLLKLLGCDPDLAEDGSEAIEMIAKKQYAIVFMDCQMPVMDGYEATHAIREREAREGGHQVIVAMTAHALQGDRERCIEAGMDDYLSKPFGRDKIHEMIERWAGEHPS